MEHVESKGPGTAGKNNKAEEHKGSDKKTQGFKISGDWKQQSDKLKERFPKLSDEDLKGEAGQEDKLINRLSSKLDKSKLEVISILKKEYVKS